MEIRTLNTEQVRTVYRSHVVRDFPRIERKPLRRIVEAMEEGTYECLGLYDAEEFLAYAFFVRHGKNYLFDYYAVLPQKRDRGIGSRFLQSLLTHFASAESLIGEIEDPAYAETEAERELRERRKRFYLRNGFRETGVSVKAFGVWYLLIEAGSGEPKSADEVREQYLEHYRLMLPEYFFRKYISVEDPNPLPEQV